MVKNLKKKFKVGDVLMFMLKNQEKFFGTLASFPREKHPYWYLTRVEDTTLVAVRDDSVEVIVQPSDQVLEAMRNQRMDEILEGPDKGTLLN